MRAYERLIKYAKVHTASAEETASVPSTARQFDLANEIADELRALGAADVFVDEHCYVYAKIPATPGCESKPTVGFIAHLDTVPDFPGENVKPRVIENYDGGAIPLGESGRTLDPAVFAHLRDLVGDTLVVTDGTTVLGADDKAGCAEIVTAAERLLASGEAHGAVALGLCPDEEIGHGAELMDLERFGASLAYTVDGGGNANEIEYENFNAAAAKVTFAGVNVHPGDAKDKMVNAALVATEYASMLPEGETPAHTEGYEGFYHLISMSGDVERAQLSYIIRDHDAEKLERRKEMMRRAAAALNAKYPGAVTIEIKDQYRNMIEMIKPRFEVVEKAEAAMRALGLEPLAVPIRGGTDGAQLSFRGLPCPNLATGSWGHHGPFEHASAERMDSIVDLILGIIAEFAK